MRARVLFIAVVVALVGFAPAPFPRAERRQRGEDQSDVIGTWAFERWETRGQRRENQERMFRVRLTKDRFLLLEGDKVVEELILILEPAASPPAVTMGVKNLAGMVGSYRVRNGRLTMILASGADLDQRPRDFESNSHMHRFVLRRVSR